jgi:hypothetical protein
MAEETKEEAEKKPPSIDSQYGYEEEKEKGFLQKIVDFIKSREPRAFKKVSEVS